MGVVGLAKSIKPSRSAVPKPVPTEETEHPAWIPQRLIRSVNNVFNPDDVLIDRSSYKAVPAQFKQHVGLIRNYPNMPEHIAKKGTDEEVAEHFINHIKDNLLDLHDRVPDEIRQRSKLWYDGARKITTDWSKKYNLPDHSIAGAIAAMSPQQDWYKNVSLAHRVIHNVQTNKGVFTPEMSAVFNSRENLVGKPAYVELHNQLAGKSLADIDKMKWTSDKARLAAKSLWIRLHDEAHGDPSYRVINPEGDFADVNKNADGKNSQIGWPSLDIISKAIGSIEAANSPKKMSALMGMKHKVRNFYNNIIAPNSKHGDVTMDTHAVAAALLRPLSGTSEEVAHNLATSAPAGRPNASESIVSGVSGLYPIYAEAYRRAAKERGILPREMQSITWEGLRGLYPNKSAKLNTAVNAIWNQHRSGKISQTEARRQIYEKTGGIKPPTWWRGDQSNYGTAAPYRGAADARKLSGSGPRGQTPEGAGPGGGSGARPPVPEEQAFAQGGDVDPSASPLLAVNNIRQKRLSDAADLGGLAVPSIAVVNPNHGYDSFGDVSLVGSKHLVAPSRHTPVFASDAYTARFPHLTEDGTKIFKGYSDAGRLRASRLTLDNVVREMKGPQRNKEGSNYGAGNVRAAVTPQFRNLAEMQQARGKLVHPDQFRALKDESNNQLVDLAGKFAPHAKTYDPKKLDYLDHFSYAMQDAGQHGVGSLRQHFPTAPDDLLQGAHAYLQHLKSMPTEYFEAKPQRAVRLSEFSGAAIPHDMGDRARSILRDNNIQNVATYRPGQRTDALKSFGDLTFKDGGDVEPDIQNPVPIFPKPQRMLAGDDFVPGGKYLNATTKQDMTGHKAAAASIGIAPGGKPYFRASADAVDATGSPKGALAKTNLFKQRAGWNWSKAPEGHENTSTIVSVEHRGKHYYTLNAHFPKGVDFARYADARSEPRLRPTTRGDIALGPTVGAIKVRGADHPVFGHVIVKQDGGSVQPQFSHSGLHRSQLTSSQIDRALQLTARRPP